MSQNLLKIAGSSKSRRGRLTSSRRFSSSSYITPPDGLGVVMSGWVLVLSTGAGELPFFIFFFSSMLCEWLRFPCSILLDECLGCSYFRAEVGSEQRWQQRSLLQLHAGRRWQQAETVLQLHRCTSPTLRAAAGRYYLHTEELVKNE